MVLFLFFNPLLKSQVAKKNKNEKKIIFDFTLTDYNNISVPAILNGTDTVKLMFHTAANAVTLTSEASKKLKSIQYSTQTDSIKSWGNQANAGRLSENNSVSIGGLHWEKVSIWENSNSGHYTDGKFGIDLFKDQILEINFDKSEITIHTTLPKKIKHFEKLPLKITNDLMFVEANCLVGDSNFTNQFLIHSGYSGALLLDDVFAQQHQLSKLLPITGEQQLKDSYGNTVKTLQAILPSFKFGKSRLQNLPVGFFEGNIGRQKMSILGGDIIKRFNWIFDLKLSILYMQPNKHFKTVVRKM